MGSPGARSARRRPGSRRIAARRERRRAPAARTGTSADPGGSEPLRAPRARSRRAVRGAASSVSPRPAECRATAISGCSAPTLPRNASKSSAAADVDPVDEPARVVDRERSLSGGERVAVQERDRLARLELEVAEHAVREIGVLCEVRLPDRAERAHAGQVVVVQGLDVALGDLRSRALVAGGESVRMTEERCAHDLVGSRRAESDEVTGDRGAVERRARLSRPRRRRDASRRPWSRRMSACPPVTRARRRATLAHAFDRVGRELDSLARTRDPDDVVEREASARSARRSCPGLYEGPGRPCPAWPPGRRPVPARTGSPAVAPGEETPVESVARGTRAPAATLRRQARRVAVRAHEHELLVEPVDMRVVEGRVRRRIEPPLEHGERDVQRTGNHACP